MPLHDDDIDDALLFFAFSLLFDRQRCFAFIYFAAFTLLLHCRRHDRHCYAPPLFLFSLFFFRCVLMIFDYADYFAL